MYELGNAEVDSVVQDVVASKNTFLEGIIHRYLGKNPNPEDVEVEVSTIPYKEYYKNKGVYLFSIELITEAAKVYWRATDLSGGQYAQ